MNINIITSKEQSTSTWSGGTTTQLYIYPKNKNYKDLDFSFRISTANINVEKSEFTILPNVSRKLMILNGEIKIEHENHHKKILEKFDTDEFEGSWKTTSIGKCTDFNVMTDHNTKSKLSYLTINKAEKYNYTPYKQSKFVFIYIYKGHIKINDKVTAKQGDFIEITKSRNEFNIHALGNCELIITNIL